MSEENSLRQDSKAMGPAAPKDPVEKRSCIYIMIDSAVEGSPRQDGLATQEIFLEGRLVDKAKLTSGITDENILELLKTCKGFHKLVHSIGVSIQMEQGTSDEVVFELNNWGKVDKYSSGTKISVSCPADGTEVLMKLEDFQWSPEDDILGKFSFQFKNPGEIANATVKFYLNDGYEVPEVVLDPPVDFASEDYQQMIKKSLLNNGNNQRLKAAIKKAQRGEDVTIAYIGGSITQGAGAKPINTQCYAYKSYLKFKQMYGKDGGENIHFIKAGVGGTPSELGIVRYDKDVLRDGKVKPDIVIVEFAVNDAGDETNGVCYESLCLKILKEENNPAIILLFSVFMNDWNLQDRLAPVGQHYNLPMVSVKDAVVDQFKQKREEGNVISKRQFFYDIFHPTNDGHTVMSDCLAYLFEKVGEMPEDEQDLELEKDPVIGNAFTNIKLLDRNTTQSIATIEEGSFTETDTDLQMVEMDDHPYTSPEFPFNWMNSVTVENVGFKMTIKSRNLILVFKDSGSRDFGKADVYVDGKLVKTLDPHIVNWTHCNPVILYQEEVTKEHEVVIKMSAENEDKRFTILGFGYTL